MSIQNIISKVSDFNYLFGIIKKPYDCDDGINIQNLTPTHPEFNISQYNLRYSLINEEILELFDAYDKNDIIEMIDAMADILYVVFGAKVYFSLPSYILSFEMNGDGDIDIEKINDTIKNNPSVLENQIQSLSYLNAMLKMASDRIINENKPEEIRLYNQYLEYITIHIFRIAQIFSINMTKYFDIVHDSNMSKICKTEYDAINSVEFYKNSRYKEPAYRKITYKDIEYFIVYDKTSEKVLKSINYTVVKFI
jgi:predicted HAD superfamily Cof-like phosphohydrolase